jgi:hypothetical protein
MVENDPFAEDEKRGRTRKLRRLMSRSKGEEEA